MILMAAVRFLALRIGGLPIFGFYLTRHASRKNVGGHRSGLRPFHPDLDLHELALWHSMPTMLPLRPIGKGQFVTLAA
jgi:hypothetical protein